MPRFEKTTVKRPNCTSTTAYCIRHDDGRPGGVAAWTDNFGTVAVGEELQHREQLFCDWQRWVWEIHSIIVPDATSGLWKQLTNRATLGALRAYEGVYN